MRRPKRSHIDVGGYRLSAEQWEGRADAPTLMLHGLGGNSVTWHAIAPAVAEHTGGRVIAVDLPGFGATRPGTGRLGLRLLTRLVVELMQTQAPEGARWHIVGNSMGAVVALQAAQNLPRSIGQLTLAALALPLGWGRPSGAWATLRQYAPVAAPGLGRRLVARYVRSTGVPGVVDDPVRALFHDPGCLDPDLRQRLIGVSEERLAWVGDAARAYEQMTLSLGLRLALAKPILRSILAAPCPVRSIYGANDPLYPLAAWRRLEALTPHWAHHEIPRVGHVPQLEAPRAFVQHMLQPVPSSARER